MKRNGTLRIAVNERGRCVATWTPAGVAGDGQPPRTLTDGAHLEELLRALEIHEDNITNVIRALHDAPAGQKTHAIPDVWLSDEAAREHGLA